ncbi:formylglycine-generating enzyme family protein [Cyanothece sp. BG0011]|uniref:formylglycine-generating enzyme family protein n=1 Tax=Cyanothece sp. BG0011 TaxID=2082950 RepID=UPI001E51F73D|nr:formylglycine-generating enzyme family protein [Cyanothece sp. BG0011]
MSRLTDLIEQLKREYPSELDLNVEELLDALWFTIVTSQSEEKPTVNQSRDTPSLSQSEPSLNTPSQPPPPIKTEAENYPPERKFPSYANTDKIDSKSKSKGIFFDVQDPPAIPDFWKQEICRTLQTLRRKIPSNKSQEIDEEATVQFIGETELYEPIFKPKFKRSLSISLIIELEKSVLIWYKVVKEIEAIFKKIGVFHEINIFWIKTNDENQVILQSSYKDNSVKYKPEQIINNSPAEQLIIIISDFSSVRWYQNYYTNILDKWSQKALVTLLQLFPKRLWNRTALDRKNPVILQSPSMGETNSPYTLNQQLTIKDSLLSHQQNYLKLPIITLDPQSLQKWVNLVSGQKQVNLPGILVKKTNLSNLHTESKPSQIIQSLSSEQILNRFYENASEKAQELAHRLSAVPVTFPIIRLIIQAVPSLSSENFKTKKVKKASFLNSIVNLNHDYELPAVIIAEVLMGGLFNPLSSPINSLSSDSFNLIELEFKPEIREALEQEATEEELVDTITLISDYISQYLGEDQDIFEALLLDSSLKAELPESVRHFAEISASTLQNLGGVYSEFVKQYTTAESSVSQPSEIPLLETLETFEFEAEVAIIVFEEEPLQQWTFETPTVNRRGEIIKTTTHTASYFNEPLTDNVILTMVAIPGGTFTMGSSENEGYSNEQPQHNVTLSAFFMGKYPITQAQWKAIASQTNLKVNIDLDEDPSNFKGDNRPVERVNWYEAVEFCQRLSKLTGRHYQLPSEAQWEYACRAVSEPLDLEKGESYPPFYFGDTITGELANYDASNTYADEPSGEESQETTSVGQFPPNVFGLYDMHGNVWEWCADDWHDNYEDAPNDGSAWMEFEASYLAKNKQNYSKSVFRGGSWGNNPYYCRSAYRLNYDSRDYHLGNIGFRVVCVFGSE